LLYRNVDIISTTNVQWIVLSTSAHSSYAQNSPSYDSKYYIILHELSEENAAVLLDGRTTYNLYQLRTIRKQFHYAKSKHFLFNIKTYGYEVECLLEIPV